MVHSSRAASRMGSAHADHAKDCVLVHVSLHNGLHAQGSKEQFDRPYE